MTPRMRRPSIATRLLLLLLPAVLAGLAGLLLVSLHELEDGFREGLRREGRAYARALGLAFDQLLRGVEPGRVAAVLNTVAATPGVYGVAIYELDGRRVAASDLAAAEPPLVTGRLALQPGSDTLVARTGVGGAPVLSLVRLVRRPDGGPAVLLEVMQPLAELERAKRALERRFALAAVAMSLLVGVLLVTLTRRVVARPLQRLVDATGAIGRGAFDTQVPPGAVAREFDDLATALNATARQLAEGRRALLHETEMRVAAERSAREHEQLAEVGLLSAGLAHEIAAPLNVISGRAELLLRQEGVAPEMARQLRIVVQQIGRIERSVRSLLGFARRSELRPARVPLAACLREMAAAHDAERQRAGATVEVDVPESLAVRADPDLLGHAVRNLLTNALDAVADAAGERRVRLAARVLDDRPGWAAVEVTDTGIGFPPEALGAPARAFRTTKPGGTGLGLLLAASIVREHGGELTACAGPGGIGAALRFALPLAGEVVDA
ncbi:MAG: ATP-binding protein [Gemmatimonadales bacterium]|nr:ATP-binding protein [Gemmatimonadales bacterium]